MGAVCLVTMSHSPLMGRNDPAAAVVAEVAAALEEVRGFVAGFAPDLVVVFAPDHYNGVFYKLMPPFCIGTDAVSIGDYDTQAGQLDVDREAALSFIRHALAAGLDPALSERLEVDHGVVQPLEILFGAFVGVRVVPVFINSVAEPFGPVARARLLGTAIGEAAADLDRRVLFLGSGGLSHDPPVPRLDGAAPEVRERLIAGGILSPEARAAREQSVLEAGRALAAGMGAVQPLNPDWDQLVMRTLAQGRFDVVDDWTPEWFTQQAGHSSHEARTWIAAYAAMAASAPYEVVTSFYRPIPEWVAGFGITAARSAA
jgi:2,3-dihydroxyphenylpropionate 1,2-dioxygenase